MTKSLNMPSAEQIEHLNEHIDQFVAITGVEEVESYFKKHPEATYAAVCDVMDLDPLPDPKTKAEQKAQEAFDSLSPREHRRAAIHDLLCPNDGAFSVLRGRPTGDMTATKVESLEQARALIVGALAHIDSAIEGYKTNE